MLKYPHYSSKLGFDTTMATMAVKPPLLKIYIKWGNDISRVKCQYQISTAFAFYKTN